MIVCGCVGILTASLVYETLKLVISNLDLDGSDSSKRLEYLQISLINFHVGNWTEICTDESGASGETEK